MVIAGLGQRLHGVARHHGAGDLQIGVGLLDRLDTHLKILHEGFHHGLVAVRALHLRRGGDHVEFGTPHVGERGGDVQRLQTPLRLVGADRHLGDRVVQVHQVAVVVGIGHDDDRAVRVRGQRRAGGAEQALGQSALAAIADDDEIVVARQLDEHGCRVTGDDQRRRLDALLIGDGLGLGKNLLCVAVRRVVITHRGVRGVERHCGVAGQRIRAYDLQRQSRMLGKIGGPPRGLVTGMRTVHPNQNRLFVDHGNLLKVTPMQRRIGS